MTPKRSPNVLKLSPEAHLRDTLINVAPAFHLSPLLLPTQVSMKKPQIENTTIASRLAREKGIQFSVL